MANNNEESLIVHFFSTIRYANPGRTKIEIDDFEVDYHFGLNIFRDGIVEGDYWEGSSLKLMGRILSPNLKNATKARIDISGSPELEGHWDRPRRDTPPQATGTIENPRGSETLQFNCWVPYQSFQFIMQSVASRKIKYATINGEKLKYRKGLMSDLNLTTKREEE